MAKRSDITDTQVQEACRRFHASMRIHPVSECYNSLIHLVEMTGLPMKVCYAAMVRAEDRGLIDCGVSLRTAWPEPISEWVGK